MKLLGVLTTTVALLLGTANVYVWLFKPDGELCFTDRWCGTTGVGTVKAFE